MSLILYSDQIFKPLKIFKLWRAKVYKRLLENPHFFQQLLESFVAKAWAKELDFSTCKSIKKSYVSPAHKETTKDMLYKVKFRGRDLYIYVLIEFQSNVQKFMIVRVLYYLASFYLDLIEQKDPPKKLPPKLG